MPQALPVAGFAARFISLHRRAAGGRLLSSRHSTYM